MGTEVQSEMYMPCYYSLRDLNDNTGNGSWSLHQQNSMLGIGQYHDFCLTRPAIDVNDCSDREQLRQTILTHESVFRHQLHELHRLYRIQRDMMNEMRSEELHRRTMQRGTPQFSFYSSGIPAVDDNGRQHTSNLFLNHGRVFSSDTDSIQCEFRSMEENILQSSFGATQNDLRLKDCEMPESECKKLQRRLFDLELPADAYMNDEEEGPGLSGVSAAESYLLSRNQEMTRDRDGNLSIQTGVNSGCIDDVPNMRYPCGWRNLNEPIKLKEASSSALTDVLGNNICSKEEMERRVLSSNSHSSFLCLSKFSQDPQKVREVGVSLNSLLLETQRRRKGWLANNTEAGQIGSNRCSLFESFPSEDLPATSKSQQTEPRNSNERVKKKLFGVEICDTNRDASVEDSHMQNQNSHFPQSNVENSESSSFSSWKKIHSHVSQDMPMVQGNPSFSSFTPSNKSSVTEMECTEGIQNKLLVCSNLRSIPSISAEASSQTRFCHSSQLESKESCVCYSSNGFSHLNLNGSGKGSSASEKLTRDGPRNSCRDLGSMMDAKSSDQKKADAVISSNGYQNEGISQCAAVSANGSRKQSSQTVLPWLKAVPSFNGCSFEERQGSSQMNLDSLRNSFQHFVDKTEMMRKSSFQSYVQDSSSATCALDAEHQRIEVGECSSSRRILGCSIFEKAPISMDHPSPSTTAKPSYPTSVVDDTNPLKDGPHNTKAADELSPKLGEQRQVEGWIEKGLINLGADSICHIDLNKSVIDEGFGEETEPTTCSSSRNNVKTSVEIDLEAPVVDERGLDVAPGFESFRSKLPPSYEPSQSKHAPCLESVQRKLPSDFESFQSKHPLCSESVQSKLPPGLESFQCKRLPDSESVQSNRPPGFESFPSKHRPCSKSVQSKLPPGFESFESKHPLGSESVRSNLPPGFESFQSKHPPGSKSVQSNLPPGSESFQSKHSPGSKSVQSNLPPGFESFQGKHPPGSKSVRSNVPPGFESFQSKHPPGSESFQSKLPCGFKSRHSELPPGFESLQFKLKEPVDRLQDQSGEPHGLITAAAQALVAISSSRSPLQVGTFCHQSEAYPGDPLHWFADVISSYKGDIQNEMESVLMGKNSVHEDILPDGMDYFEYMTLNLAEAKVEEIGAYRPPVFENSKNENILLKRPRRGQARRGRQRKDFQRDVLPTLSSLLKNEVSEDLQTIEGLIQATGGTWRSSLVLKNTRSGGGRRKRHVRDSDGLPNATETQLSNCREMAIEDHSNLFGWGKRTRRPPRQRYPITNPPLAIK